MKDHKPGVRHGAADACLHCYLLAAIDSYCEDANERDPESGALLYDVRVVLGHVADVAAEFLAGHPDRTERRRWRREFDDYLTRRVAECVATGRHPKTKIGKLQ